MRIKDENCDGTDFKMRVAVTLPELSEWTLCILTVSRASARLLTLNCIKLYRPDSFCNDATFCANFKAIRYESTSLNRIVADKSHRVIVA